MDSSTHYMTESPLVFIFKMSSELHRESSVEKIKKNPIHYMLAHISLIIIVLCFSKLNDCHILI